MSPRQVPPAPVVSVYSQGRAAVSTLNARTSLSSQEKSYNHQQSPPQAPAAGTLVSVSAGPQVLGISATHGFYVTDCVQALSTLLRMSYVLRPEDVPLWGQI